MKIILGEEDRELFKDVMNDLLKHFKKQAKDLKKLMVLVENIEKKIVTEK